MGAPYSDEFAEDVIKELLDRLAEGQSLNSICHDKRMPDASTFMRWAKADDDLAASIARARETGYYLRGERAVEAAKCAEDAAKGRLALDAERWFLGKLSVALADKSRHEHSGPDGDPIKHQHDVTEEAANAFTRAIAGLAARE